MQKKYRTLISTSARCSGFNDMVLERAHTCKKKLRKYVCFFVCAPRKKKLNIKFAKYIKALVVWLLRDPRSTAFILYAMVAQHRFNRIFEFARTRPRHAE